MYKLGVVILFLLFVVTADAKTPTPKPSSGVSGTGTSVDRIAGLEKRVERLEKEVRLLREIVEDLGAQVVTTRSRFDARERADNPKYPLFRIEEDRDQIRKSLKEGMTKEEVRKLIGEPDRVDPYAITGTTWYYGLRHVDFGYNGLVVGWFGF